ncbi:hypothetical protein Cni_G08048 [Canna indica]|uniref:Uncharacterized protein n=1 Tax=Canna indica TaxID=4628 RepID=A0AAQ3K057_9LILI|nr:hypothetical protein Cni_G08048 [Canna indica]
MEELCKQLDDLTSEMKVLKEEYQDKVVLSESLRRAHEEQLARIQEANVQIEKQTKKIDAKVEEISMYKKKYEDLESRFAEKESALKHLDLINDNLKISTRKKLMDLEEKNRELILTLDEANTKLEDQEKTICSYKEEIEGLKGLLVASQKRCFDAELRARAPIEVTRREEVLLKLEEEKTDTENQLKWKIEQFNHLEEAHRKLQKDFQVAKKEWALERSNLVDEIGTLQMKLDSQAVLIEDLTSEVKMCNEALAYEESRRKLLEVKISESKTLYDKIFSDYEEARLTIEAITAKRDEEIASLRISMASKSTLVKEMEFRSTQLEQENKELKTSLREFQNAQVNGADTTSATKNLRNKIKNLEHAHRSCSEKLKAKEAEFGTQIAKLEKDLDNCFCELISKDKQILDLQLELEACQSSLMLQKLDNEEMTTVLMLVKSKFYESSSVIENLQLKMAQHNAKVAEKTEVLMEQLEWKKFTVIQAQVETLREHDTGELLKKELEICRGKIDELYLNIDCIKHQASEKETAIQDSLQRTLADLERANHALAEKTSELNEMKFELQQRSFVLEKMEKAKFLTETELNNYRDESKTIRKRLDAAVAGKMETEKELRQVREYFCKLNSEKDKIIEELQQKVSFLEEDNERMKFEISSLFKTEAEKFSEKEKKLLEFAKVIDRRLRETQEAITTLEEKLMHRETKILSTFQQEIAKYLHVMEDNEEIISELEHHITLLEEDVNFFVEVTTSQLEEKKVEIHTLSDALGWITATYVLKEHEFEFKAILISELGEEINTLQLNLKSEKNLSFISRNCAEQLQAELCVQSLENEKKQSEVLNELKVLQLEKQIFLDQLGEVKSNVEALHNTNAKLSSEKEELIQEMSELSDMISRMYHVDEELTSNWKRIMQKIVDESTATKSDKKDLHCTDIVQNEIHVSSLKNNVRRDCGKRSPLKEHNC